MIVVLKRGTHQNLNYMTCQQTTPSSERQALGFETGAVDRFSFLESDYGFRCISRSSTYVRFESDAVFVNVYHGRSSYELGVEVGRLSEDANARLRLPTIIAALANGAEEPKSFFQASEKNAIQNCLMKLGSLVESYCGNLLNGDEDTFKRVQIVAEQISEKLTEHYAHAPLRHKADTLWREKKYVDALRIYEQFSKSLTPAEQRRVAFAKRKEG